MDATCLDTVINLLIDELTLVSVPGGDVDRSLCHLLGCPGRVVDEEPLLAVLAAAVTLGNLCGYVIAAAVAVAERAGIPARKRLRSGVGLLTGLGVAPGAAYRAVRVGRVAHTLPALTRQQRLGAVGIELVDAVGKGVAHIDSRVGLSDEERVQVVRTLVIQATPSGVDAKAREIAIAGTAAAPPPRQGEESPGVPVAEDADLNEMALCQNEEGRISAGLDLDALTGGELFAALDPLCRPVPLPDGSPDSRSIGRRCADAFGQLVRTYLSGSGRPTSGGVLPHVTLIRPVTAATIRAAESVDVLGFTGPIGTATAELIGCDCTVTTVFVDGGGAPLDVGRAERLFPPHIRKALAIRDRGCCFPGCGRPVSWCDAHHLTRWGAGGVHQRG